jgi:hypothetical protein
MDSSKLAIRHKIVRMRIYSISSMYHLLVCGECYRPPSELSVVMHLYSPTIPLGNVPQSTPIYFTL